MRIFVTLIFPGKSKIYKGRIFQKKREKMLKMSGGVSKIKSNIRIITEFKPEQKAAVRSFNRVKIKLLKK